jgi:class 3 adenylate cyclase
VTRDRILTTILSTDIVASTAMAARLGDRAWRDVLGEHHGAVRCELKASNGVEIDGGDGFLATFDVPATVSGALDRSSGVTSSGVYPADGPSIARSPR